MPIHHLDLSDRQHDLVEVYALVQGLTTDQAATKLMHEAIAERYTQATHKPPARIYEFSQARPS